MEKTSHDEYLMTHYYSKSKAFLYPLLGFKMVETFRPKGTYLVFQEHHITSYELSVCYEHDPESLLFRNFERMSISPHPYLRACYRIPNGSVYVFTLGKFSKDVDMFLQGAYSQFSESAKALVLRHFDDNIKDIEVRSGRRIHAILFPDLYRKLAAKELGVPLKEMPVELAPLYDLDKETFSVDLFSPCRDTHTI